MSNVAVVEKRAYKRSDKFIESRQRSVKQFNLSADNHMYFDEFQKSINPTSWPTYKAIVGNFLESIGDIDFVKINPQQTISWINGRKTAESCLKSLLTFILSNDINNAVDKVNKENILWMVNISCK